MEREPLLEMRQSFLEMCQRHDLTYSYSDDGEVWRRGEESLRKIKAKAKAMPKEEVKKIWNAVVDSKIREGYRDPFYWRDTL